TYRWYVNVTDGTHWTREIFEFQTGFPTNFDPFTFGWQYRKQITIDHTQVTGDLVNFTVLLSTIDPDLIKAQTDGEDILFMNSTGAAIKLHHEIEVFNQATGALLAWVNIPSLSSVEDTALYLYYGNPNCVDQEYPEKTWDSNYILVYHMNDLTTSIVKDSTTNNNGGTKKGANEPIQTIGKIGYAQYFDGVGDYITTNSAIALGSNPWTYECWYKADSYGHSEDPYTDKYSEISTVQPSTSVPYLCIDISNRESKDRIRTYMDNVPSHGYSYTNALASPFDNNTRQITVVRDNANTDFKIYLNGATDYTVAGAVDTSYSITTNKLRIGGSAYNPSRVCFEGFIDEIRVSKIVRSSQWISTSFNTQNNPEDFISIGTEESGP
ncbi:MAG TPA: DUF2341 domain-containing protein, partial [Candidatus Thermoplasmatota archaeon]|nr:DUF2341 domain-containing protein [Candidatus Thermoplasmatota archaeon]